jgi:hypothetical protein
MDASTVAASRHFGVGAERAVVGCMRAFVWVIFVLSGCSLQQRPSSLSSDAGSPPPDAPPPIDSTAPLPDTALPLDADPPLEIIARCEDGQIYSIAVTSTNTTQPPHGSGPMIGHCQGGCRSAAAFCPSGDCASAIETLCEAPVSQGATCSLDGAPCQGAESIDCPETSACSEPVPNATCACTNGSYSCTPVTTAATTQAGIVGKWHGVVTPPTGFPAPWPITLWIYPDGTYWAECAGGGCIAALWFEPDGPSPRRRITLLSTMPLLGAWASITVDTGFSPPNVGELSALVVNDTTLRFTFTAGYWDCGQPIDVNLARD